MSFYGSRFHVVVVGPLTDESVLIGIVPRQVWVEVQREHVLFGMQNVVLIVCALNRSLKVSVKLICYVVALSNAVCELKGEILLNIVKKFITCMHTYTAMTLRQCRKRIKSIK